MKSKLGLLVILFFVFVSCKKEEDPAPATPPTNNNTNQGSIIGTWTWTEAYTPDANGNYTVALNPNGVPTGKQITYASNGTYNANWNFSAMGTPNASSNDNGTYTNADSLIMTSSVTGGVVRAKINKLTSNELWFRYDGNQSYEVRFAK